MEAYLKLKQRASYFSFSISILGAILFSDCLLHPGSFIVSVTGILLFFSGLLFYFITTSSAQDDVNTKDTISASTGQRINITEKRFGFMIEHAIDIISLLDENNKIIYINEAIAKITGYSVTEVKTMPLSRLIHPD